MEEEWERANRSTQTRMGWGTKYGVLGRKHSGGEESAHSHTKEEQSGSVNRERPEETAHGHTQEEQSRGCEQGETWGDSPQSHTGRAVQGVWTGRDLRSQPTVTHRKSSPGSVKRERPEESTHSHTQEERSRECEQGEPGGVSPQSHTGRAVQGVWTGRAWRSQPTQDTSEASGAAEWGGWEETWSKRQQWPRSQSALESPGRRASAVSQHEKRDTTQGAEQSRDSACVRFKVSGCHSAENKSQKRARNLWEAPWWPGEWPWPCWARDPLQRLNTLWG